jgi:diadenosine tetraphosphate (Ap4A) HIT family hydrolase
MAIFHLNAHVVSRGKGQSAIAKAAYNSRAKLEDERTGQTKDYQKLDGLMFSGVFAPKDAPAWASDRQQLWNAVERREDESNRAASARLAREIRIALPHELTDQQREWLVKDFVREQFTRKGMIADVNIHAPGGEGDDRNYHAHILATLRTVGPEGFGLVNREWNKTEQVEQWRAEWERMANKQLERHGHDARIDRRTLEAQGIEREPTTHRGPHVDAIERRGVEADNSRQNEARADELAGLRAALSNITRDIAAERNELAAEVSAAPEQIHDAPANENEIPLPEIELGEIAELGSEVLETAPVDVAGGGLKILSSLVWALDQEPAAPPPPQTREEVAGQRADRLAHAERMLHDRDYRRRYEAEQQTQKRLDADRKREDDERGRARERY